MNPSLSRSNNGGGSKSASLDESDRQRLISDFATRAIAAHRQCIANGGVLNKLPKSESNITFLSDENPRTTKNPIYHEDGTLSSPEIQGKSQRRRDLLGNFSPSRKALREAWLRLSSPGCDLAFGGYSGSDGGWGSGSGHSWTLPSRLHQRQMYDALRRQVVMDPVQWELELLKAEFKESKDGGLDSGFDRGLDSDLTGSPSLEPKLTVKEQARQFEQQARQEMRQRQSRDSRGSLSSDIQLSVFPETPQHHKQSPTHRAPSASTTEAPPSIIVTLSEGGTPPPSHKPTPPVLRRFGANLTRNHVEDRLQVHLEVIPDPPTTPPPPPPPPTTSAPLPPSFTPVPPSSAPLSPTSASLPPSSPPPHQPPSPPPASPSSSQSAPPPPPPAPPPPPPPPPLLPQSPSLLRPSTFVLPSFSEAPTLRPVSLRPSPPPVRVEPDLPRKELKGILKNIQNIADIEKSVANMFSQIDQKQVPLKKVMKSRASMDSLDSLDSLDVLEVGGEKETGGKVGEGVGEGGGEGECPASQQIPNPNMNSIVEELEKRFPSQSTML